MKLKTYNLLCRFCQKQCGTYDYPSELSVDDLKIADIRCEQHEAEFGSYSKMEQDFQGTHKDFLTTIAKAEYKRTKFDIELAKLQTEKEPVLGATKKKTNLKIKQKRVKIK